MSNASDSSRNRPPGPDPQEAEGEALNGPAAPVQGLNQKSPEDQSRYLTGPRILPRAIRKGMSVTELVQETFLAYNAGRLREACRLLAERMLEADVTVGLAVSGALTPAGLGLSALSPLLRGGYVDWVVSTGANLYHDTHFGLNLPMHQGSPHLDDRELRQEQVVRIYDVLFDYRVLLSTDAFYREMIQTPPFQKILSSAEFHHLAGKFIREREKILEVEAPCFLSTAWECGVPVYTSSPGDSSIGMNIAATALTGNRLTVDPNRDVNETAAIVYDAKRRGKSGIWILGGGSPKNFVLQTEPQIQEVLGIEEDGHDYFLQITDARPDTGGLSGATPSEAVSWGKVDPDMLPHAVVAYVDSTIALPILAAYVLETVPPRPLKRLYDRREQMLEALTEAHLRAALDRQGAAFQQKVQERQAQFEARLHETQSQINEKLRQRQAQIQADLNRMQQQVQERVQKLLPQARPKREDEGK